MSAPANVIGAEKVIEAAGYWPSFHDAEVISFSAERALPFAAGKTLARMAVHVRQYTTVGEGTAQYDQVLTKSVLVRFLFTGAHDLELSGFNHQNVIDSISVTSTDSELEIEIESIWGFGGTLLCSKAEIESVEVLPNADV